MYLKLILLATFSSATVSFTGEETKQQGPRTRPYQTSQALDIPRNKKNRGPVQLDSSPFSSSPNLLTFCTYSTMLGSNTLKKDNSPNAWMH